MKLYLSIITAIKDMCELLKRGLVTAWSRGSSFSDKEEGGAWGRRDRETEK